MAGNNTKKKTSTSGKTSARDSARSASKNTSRTSTKKKAAAPVEQDTGFLQSEALILGVFAVSVFLFLSNFHICGMLGNVLSSVMLGVFGSIGYLAPVLLFAGMLFYVSNKGNIRAVYKMLAVEILLLVLCGLAQLMFGGGYQEGQTLKEIYDMAGESGKGGGVIGGALVLVLHTALGTIGAYLVLLVFMIICIVCITEKSFVSAVKRGSGRAYQYAREDYGRRKEIREVKREEKRLLREEQRVQGVNLNSTDLSKGAPLNFGTASQTEFAENFQANMEPEAAAKAGFGAALKAASGKNTRAASAADSAYTAAAHAAASNYTAAAAHGTISAYTAAAAHGTTSAYTAAAANVSTSARTAAAAHAAPSGYTAAPASDSRNVPFDGEPEETSCKEPAAVSEKESSELSFTRPDPADVFRGKITMAGKDPEEDVVPFEEDTALMRRHMDEDVFVSKNSSDFDAMGVFPKREIPETWETKNKEADRAQTGHMEETGLRETGFAEPEEELRIHEAETVGAAFEEKEPEHSWQDEPILLRAEEPERNAGADLEDSSLDTEPYVETEDYWEPVNRTEPAREQSHGGQPEPAKESAYGGQTGFAKEPSYNGHPESIAEPSHDSRSESAHEPSYGTQSESAAESAYTQPESAPEPAFTARPESTESFVYQQAPEPDEEIPAAVRESLAAESEPAKPTPAPEKKKDEPKQVVTSTGKVIVTDAEEIIKQKAEKRRQDAAEKKEADATVRREVEKTEQKPKKPYVIPPMDLLKQSTGPATGQSEKEFKETAIKLQQTLRNFGVGVTVTNISCGPTVTRYELHPEQGVKVSKIQSLADDIKLNLAATDIRIEAPIPGKAAVGIEVPNKVNSIVYLRELLESEEFKKHPSRLAFAVGKDIGGQVVVADLAKMPHLLIAGQTGSGKSVGINTMIMSLIYRASPDDVKLIMIDPKVVELSVYNKIPHLLIPVVTDPKKAAGALNWAVAEMMERYNKFAQSNVRDLKGYNARIKAMEEAGDVPADQIPKKLPQLVIIIDELADLMMVASNEVEDAICRLAQLARAAGIHLVIATQRPSVNVITGVIKANVPSRIAFSVASGVDSRTILDMNGAEKLLGNGDMLFYPSGYPKPLRVQGAFVSDPEVSAVTDFLKEQYADEGSSKEMELKLFQVQSQSGANGGNDRDALFTDAGRFIIEKDKASIGMLQRMFKIGFNRAARIMDQLAEAGVVGEEEGTKPRKVLMSMEEFEEFIEAGY